MDTKIKSTVYIDEAGDLGVCRGTRWFVISGVIVDKADEGSIRTRMSGIKSRLNVNEIHLRKIQDFYRRGFIVRELDQEAFTYVNIIADTNKFDEIKIDSPSIAYNYLCRMLLERVSWFLRDSGRVADIVLSARGTSRDTELIDYIKEKLIPFPQNQIFGEAYGSITAKTAGSWDLLQLADVCATTMFLAYQENGWGFCTPCYLKVLQNHLYRYNGKVEGYGIKYFMPDMKPSADALKCNWPCQQKEKAPGVTTT